MEEGREEIKEEYKDKEEVNQEKEEKTKVESDISEAIQENEDINKEEKQNDKDLKQNEPHIKLQIVKASLLKKEELYKIITFVALAIVVITCFSVAGIFYAGSVNREEKLVEELQEEEQEEEVASEETINSKIPVYTEEAKERMKHIYEWVGEEEKIAYLTFDDGPSENITPQILEILKNEDVKATFFVLGSRVELRPELVKRAYEEGHYIANHGYSHVYTSIYSSAQAVLDEYNNTERKIKEAIGNEEYSSHLFRFPGGSEGGKYAKVKNAAKALLEENNISHINWNALTNDAVGKPTHESLLQDLKITQNGKNKIVVLMHDTGTKQLTADTLPEIIHYLKEQGYVFKNFYDIMY